MGKFIEDFKAFALKGNVVDMAVGVIVGGAFTAIVNGLSNYILKPLINALLGWVPMCIAVVMLVVVFFHPIEKDMAAMRAERG